MTQWTFDEARKLRELQSQGLSFSEIGRKLGKPRNACISKFHRGEYASGRSGKRKSLRKDLWTEEEVSRMRALFAEGKTNQQIADALGRPLFGTQQKRISLGLKRMTPAAKLSRPAAPRKNSFLRRPASLVLTIPSTNIRFAETDEMMIDALGEGTCRWPLAEDVSAMTYCGAECARHVYCAGHMALAWREGDTHPRRRAFESRRV